MNINFNLWLLIITISSAIIAVIDKCYFEKKRFSNENIKIKKINSVQYKNILKHNKKLKPPFFAHYARCLLSIFVGVLIIRGFLIGNFLIPSSSMVPTLPVGNLILVNKSAYGIRNPINNEVWLKNKAPKRGDVVVFKFPLNKNIHFVKRIIGLPGDVITYKNKRLIINGIPVESKSIHLKNKKNIEDKESYSIFREYLNNKTYQVSINNDTTEDDDFVNLKVPSNMYFMMGDNRDYSEDSRYWGFVSEEELVGKAFLIWFGWNSENHKIRWDQIGKVI